MFSMKMEFAALCEATVRGDPGAAEKLRAAVLPYVRTIVSSALRTGGQSRPAAADSDLRRRLRLAANQLTRNVKQAPLSQEAIAGHLARWICDHLIADLRAENRRRQQDTVRRTLSSRTARPLRAPK